MRFLLIVWAIMAAFVAFAVAAAGRFEDEPTLRAIYGGLVIFALIGGLNMVAHALGISFGPPRNIDLPPTPPPEFPKHARYKPVNWQERVRKVNLKRRERERSDKLK